MHLNSWIRDTMNSRYQRVVFNGQASSWAHVKAGAPPRWIPDPLFFLISINDLRENIKSTVKLFPDNTSIFHVVKGPNTSPEILNHDLTRISEQECKWKMSFNSDPLKQSYEATKTNHPNINFNSNTVQNSPNQKHLSLILNEKPMTILLRWQFTTVKIN